MKKDDNEDVKMKERADEDEEEDNGVESDDDSDDSTNKTMPMKLTRLDKNDKFVPETGDYTSLAVRPEYCLGDVLFVEGGRLALTYSGDVEIHLGNEVLLNKSFLI